MIQAGSVNSGIKKHLSNSRRERHCLSYAKTIGVPNEPVGTLSWWITVSPFATEGQEGQLRRGLGLSAELGSSPLPGGR